MKVPIIILISMLIVISVSGCTSQRLSSNSEQPVNMQTTEPSQYTQTTESGKTIEFVQVIDSANGYIINKPIGWFSGIKDNKYIEIADKTNKAIIWPVVLSGNYTKANAIDMANYLIGQIKEDYADFSIKEIHKSNDNLFIEIIATIEENSIKKQAVYTVIVKNSAAFMSSYSSSKGDFTENEPVMRKIISSYKMIEPELKTDIKKIELVDWSDPEGSMTGRIPKDWTAKLISQCETRSIRIYDNNNPANQIFIYPMLGPFYTTNEARDFDRYYRDVYGWSQLTYADNPVVPYAIPRAVLEQALPEYYETTLVKTYFPWFSNLDNVEILHEEPANAEITSLFSAIGGDSAGMIFSFTESGNYPGLGVSLVGTYPVSIDQKWYFYIAAYSAKPDEFADIAPTLLESIDSLKYTDSFLSECEKVQQMRAETIKQNFKTIQQTNDIIFSNYRSKSASDDTIFEKYSDATLGRERVYTPDTGEVYQVDNGFYDYYNTAREQYEMNNLQTLSQSQWNLVPLDGALHIK
ncbi:MAG: hypothetical protein HZB65_04125 [Candidatus Aenigmarchaeota archaeon]|nr:hypothetical protein [Candidatus Aenigmarchaeota archaeon]